MRALLGVLLAASVHAAPALKLPDDAKPLRYRVALSIDPHADSFAGSIDIELDVRRGVDTLWLDATDLEVERATFVSRGQERAARVLTGDRHVLGFAFDGPLPVGKARLHVEYHAPLSATQVTGAAKQHDGADDYVITQLAPIDARRVFPCFDEPGYKTPWQLTLTVPTSDRALSNTRVVDEKDLGDGHKRIRFDVTPSLPSYLVAFAVGPFDVIDAGRSSTSRTPVRIVLPKGRTARWPVEITATVLARVEAYFGTSYPFGKLDCLFAPHFAYGAMENPGLIVFDGAGMPATLADESIGFRRDYAETAVHEISHQWFGNLVTMKWWDDVWLNEGFATWVTQAIVEAWQPGWGAAETRIDERSNAMNADALSHAGPVRHRIESYDDIQTVYDGITYDKGATVIGMFERLVGADTFRRGVLRYLAEHPHGSADAHDFVAAISRAARRDVSAAFFSFLGQAGTPVVSFALDCAHTPAVLHFTQRRYRALGVDPVPDETWQIPMCVRWPAGHACTLLAKQAGELALPDPAGCPAWVEPNDGGAGYYRVALGGDLLARLEGAGLASLGVAEKMSLLSDTSALGDAGELDLGVVLTLAEKLANDPSRHVVEPALGATIWLDDSGLVAAKDLPAYMRWLDRLFGARARSLGLRDRKDDDEDTRLLRARLVPAFAFVTGDRELVAEARTMAKAWLVDPGAIDGELVGGVLKVAARHGDEATWQAWLDVAKQEHDDSRRRELLGALGQFRDPHLVSRSLALLENPAFDPHETVALPWIVGTTPENRQLAWSWLQAHFDGLAARLPRELVLSLVSVPEGLCDAHAVEPVRAFFEPRLKDLDGGARSLAMTLERLRSCAVTVAAESPAVARFFSTPR